MWRRPIKCLLAPLGNRLCRLFFVIGVSCGINGVSKQLIPTRGPGACRCGVQMSPSSRLRVPSQALPGMSRQGSFVIPFTGGRLERCRSVSSISSASALVHPVPTPLDRCAQRVASWLRWCARAYSPVAHGFAQNYSVHWARQGMAMEATTPCCSAWRARSQKPSTRQAARDGPTRSDERGNCGSWAHTQSLSILRTI